MDMAWSDISIAGISLRLYCEVPWIVKRLKQRYQEFPGSQGAQISVHINLDEEMGSGLRIDDQISIIDGGIILGNSSKVGYFDYHAKQGTLLVQPEHVEAQVDYFLRAIYSLLVFLGGGVLLHSAGILSGERAYLFMGASGSGKTTVCRVSEGKIILNDDLLILLPSPAGWMAFATPFWNPTQVRPSNTHALVAGIYKLVQAPMVECLPMEIGMSLAEVLACVPLLTTSTVYGEQLIQRCFKIVTEIPVYRLRFLPDATFWNVV